MAENNALDLFYQKAFEFHRNGDFENAIIFYKKTAAVDPYHFVIHYHMGAAQYGLGKMDDAIDSFNNAIYIDPTNAMPYFDLGNIYANQKKSIQPILCYVKAIEMQPDHADAHNNLDVVLNTIDDPHISKSTYKKMFDKNNNVYDVGPQRIRIETSSACNLRCQHCPTGIDYKGTDRTIMTLETFSKIIFQIRKFKIIQDSVLYLGGEPLMNKNLSLMCKRIKEETAISRTMFNTNAMLLDEEKCKELSTANIDQIGISIDGRSPEENDQVRKGSDYATVLKNTRMLKQFLLKTQIVISNTLIKRLGDPEKPEIPDFLLHDFPGYPIESTYAMEWPGLNIHKSSLEKLSLAVGPKKNFCKRPFTEMAVRPNGDVIICCYDILGQHVMGNIHDTELLSIWNSPAYRALRNNMLAQNGEFIPGVCKRCVNFTGYIPIIQD